jgi:hypothetical protein
MRSGLSGSHLTATFEHFFNFLCPVHPKKLT